MQTVLVILVIDVLLYVLLIKSVSLSGVEPDYH